MCWQAERVERYAEFCGRGEPLEVFRRGTMRNTCQQSPRGDQSEVATSLWESSDVDDSSCTYRGPVAYALA